MRLYYHAGACSTSNLIALEEAELSYEAIPVDLSDPHSPATAHVKELNAMAQLPVLVLDDGTVLTQNVAILPYIADLAPEKSLFPPRGRLERVQAESWLSFIAADLHTAFATEYAWTLIWDRNSPEWENAQQFWMQRLDRRLKVLDDRLAHHDFIAGSSFTVIDAYALIVLNWAEPTGFSISSYENIMRYLKRLNERPAVQRVMKREGLSG